MNLQQLEQIVVKQNPHWQNRDVVLGDLEHRRDVFDLLYSKVTTNRQILVLSGPRRTGKTYLQKQLMTKLIKEEATPPKNILYFLFNSSQNEENVVLDLVNLFLEKYADRSKPAAVFLDEVQYIDYWQDQIKSFYDLGKQIKFIVTGSTSLFYRQKSRESLLGRIEKIPIDGLSFKEYLRFKGLIKEIKTRGDYITNLSIFQTEFPSYLTYGHFPQLIFEPSLNKDEYLNGIVDQLVNFDIPYFHKKLNRTLFSNLFQVLCANTTFELSISNIAKTLEADRQEITEYIKILDEVELFKTCTNAYYKGIRGKLSANKKIYSMNINLALAGSGFIKENLSNSRVFGQFFENYVYFRLHQENRDYLEFYRGKSLEADFVTHESIVEVKSGGIKNEKKYLEIAKKLNKKLIFVTKEEVENRKDFDKIPAYLL